LEDLSVLWAKIRRVQETRGYAHQQPTLPLENSEETKNSEFKPDFVGFCEHLSIWLGG
jgi:hypothetical protein